MSNSDYILGKSLGLLAVFLGVNVVFFFIVALVHIVFTDVPFQILPYLAYIGLVSVPTLIFIFGLSFFMMSLIRNQAVTFILLLGYFAVSLIVLNFKYDAAFDAVAFFLPLAYSDFVGFADFGSILIQRFAYFSLGFGFIWASILMFKRLPQSRAMSFIARICTVVFLATGVVLFGWYLRNASLANSSRAEMMALNDQYENTPIVTVKNYTINLSHQGDKIKSLVQMQVENQHAEVLQDILFSLNPGLQVESVLWNGEQVPVDRKQHLILLKPDQALASGEEATITLDYAGKIDKNACYVAVPAEERAKLHEIRLYKLGKEFAFITPDYVLLTQEANWYPISGTTHGTKLVHRKEKFFANFELNVETKKSLLAISQGDKTGEQGKFSFSPQTPLTQISLAIGPYVERSIQVDSVTYNLFTHKKHNFFIEHSKQAADTLESIIREVKNDYELRLNLEYPFRSLSFVEVPIHFKTYQVPLVLHRETVQPMQVLLPENGVPIDAVDFKRHTRNMTERLEHRNQTMSETEVQSQAVRRFIESELVDGQPRRPWESLEADDLYAVFPNYYYFTNHLQSQELPIIDVALEAYLKSKVESTGGGILRFHDAITDEEQANIKLREHSMQDILSDPENADFANAVVKVKSSSLFRLFESKIGTAELENFLRDIISKNRFQALSTYDFDEDLQNQFQLSLQDELNAWYEQTEVPGYYFTDFRNYKVLDGNRQRYQVQCTLYNPEPVDGVVVIDFRIMDGPGRFGQGRPSSQGASDYETVIYMGPNQVKRVSLLLDDQPRGITFNTLVSKNLPSETGKRFEEFEENTRARPIEGETILNEPPVLELPGEYIVDNENEGFKPVTEQKQMPLQKLLNVDEQDASEYMPFRPWWGPNYWRNTLNSLFYGDFVHSAYYIRAGEGDSKVAWEYDLPESGQYAVYHYMENFPMRGGRRGEQSYVQDFHFIIHHDDGQEEVEWNSESAEGWNYLGTFYFSQGPTTVELSNRSQGRIVIADAVKWVKK